MTAIKGFRNGCLPSLILWAGIIALIASCSDTGGGSSIITGPHWCQPDQQAMVVHTADPATISAECERRFDLVGVIACAEIHGSQIWVPHWRYLTPQQLHALLGHEQCHLNGWPAEHGE